MTRFCFALGVVAVIIGVVACADTIIAHSYGLAVGNSGPGAIIGGLALIALVKKTSANSH